MVVIGRMYGIKENLQNDPRNLKHPVYPGSDIKKVVHC
jgi:hypothetical protein